MRGKGHCGSKPVCDDDAYLENMKKTTEAIKKDQDARMKKEMKGIAAEMKKSKKLDQMITNPLHELNNLGGRSRRRRGRKNKKLTRRK